MYKFREKVRVSGDVRLLPTKVRVRPEFIGEENRRKGDLSESHLNIADSNIIAVLSKSHLDIAVTDICEVITPSPHLR